VTADRRRRWRQVTRRALEGRWGGRIATRRRLHRRALGGDRGDLRRHPAPSVRDRADRRLAGAGALPVLRGAGRALPARLRAGAVDRRRPRAARRVDHHVRRARRRRAPRRARSSTRDSSPRGGLGPRRGGDAAGPDQPRLHELPARGGLRPALPRGAGRAAALLLDLLGGRQGAGAGGVPEPALLALDRHVRRGGVRRSRARRARGRRRDGGAAGRDGARAPCAGTSSSPAATSGCSGRWATGRSPGRSPSTARPAAARAAYSPCASVAARGADEAATS
jgi:hypothetical protein